ncbi:MAG: helix-turn-helix transcriptional regulator [Bacillota bacterium]|nr:helix-turn-helix transcriptional regulator [Bacillota bacterium]
MTDKKREIDLGQIGQRIQTARMKKNESVRDLAEKVGVSDRHIQAVESGGSGLSFPLFCDIRKELGISADYLIDGDGLIESRDSRRRFLERKITQQLQQCSLSQLEKMETIIQQIIAMNEK